MSAQLFVLAALPATYAVPQPFLWPRAQQSPIPSPSGSLSPKIWGPILAISIIFFALVIWHTTTQPWLRRIFRGITATSHSATTELTAEQLAGSINRNTNNADNSTPEARPRRTRRARRTPSQISTRSLPAYMKEPGEHELVIIRGSADMHDVPQPVAMVMPSVDEDAEDAVNRSQSNEYPPLPHSPTDMPFLHGHEPHNDNVPRTPAVGLDPRGEAPTYEEAISVLPMQSPPLSHISLNDSPFIPASLPTTPELPHLQRRSGLRSLWSAMNPNRLSHTSRIHRRNDSDSSSNESPSRTRNALTYHGSPSVTSIFRPLSRQRSINSNHLTSPSVISINSISSPLTHTAVRTEFTFPRAGPTPEQFKLISSSDALARFGRPYGADAIAFAASTSRQELDPPPPNFDASSSTTHLLPGSRPSESPSPSPRLNTQVEPLVRTQLEDIPQSATQTHDEHPPSPAEADHDDATTDRNNSATSKHPVSFRAPTEFGVRTESRLSSHSMQSFATAEESIATRGMPLQVDPNENSS